ncbi:hypothetical protein E1262_16285 [Jiangella aurantiaca]|uniref:Uncharacterized protein n=1 Tax=Jiangella aurantiaca TaxID=2530373 RepID=A0A4R5ABJ7_9ACTN|nr:hypothetical protein [Jiangella aurantiaca]TDD68359.1 hypothetical protein E1262_16285 [Jiangella aurantiaca]
MTADEEEEARRERLQRFLADEVWPRIPAEVRGHAPTKAEREVLLGDDPADLVRAGYDAALPAYAALEHDTWPRTRWLRELSALLEPGSAVLENGLRGSPRSP